ncbi:unnamed protein product [Hermetia illucens]|uniref:Uncharacterized protein n=1 Tax=Hermetia illucens TaxID=343691 RepID=A0A7R8YQT0_HERIL|nr:unnamed protein product [Hermetia illucens]
MQGNKAIRSEAEGGATSQRSQNHFKVIVDKWFEDRRAEEEKELNEYDEKVDTYENFVKNLYEQFQHNSTRFDIFTRQTLYHFPGDIRGSGPVQHHQQQMVNLANGIRWLFDFVEK